MPTLENKLAELVKTDQFQYDLQHLYNLKYRWADERAYENFDNFITAAKNCKSIKVEGLTKTFNVTFKVKDTTLKLCLRAKKWFIKK